MKSESLALKGRQDAANGESPRVAVQLPETFQEACDIWGQDAAERIFAGAVKDVVMTRAKAQVKAGRTPEEIEQALIGWAPGSRAKRTPTKPTDKVLKHLNALSEEERALVLEQLAKDPRFSSTLATA